MTKQASEKLAFQRSPSLRYFVLLLLVALVMLPLFVDANAMDPNDAGDGAATTRETVAEQRRRKQAKMWYMRRIEVGDQTLPVSPASLFIIFFSIYYLVSNWAGDSSSGGGNAVFCEASHILIMDHTDSTQATLKEYQQKIKDDPELFAKHAKKYSTCPSKSNGGNLGKFRPGEMAPPFDRMCFAPDTPMKTTVGPVHTQFGWHLIYIHNRQLPE